MLSIGMDIGGTKILGALVDLEGKILVELRVPSPAQDPDLMVSTVVQLIEDLTSQATDVIAGVGVAAAGFIDADQAQILYAPNLNWRNEPLRERLNSELATRYLSKMTRTRLAGQNISLALAEAPRTWRC